MNTAYCWYIEEHGGPHNLHDAGMPMQAVVSTTKKGERKELVSRARGGMERLARRALELQLINFFRHDDVLERIAGIEKAK
jgi:hypothetical protein